MTNQEIFDKVAKHLVTQGRRATGYNRSFDANTVKCMYRSPEGLSCAVGCLIPDEMYTPDMEWNYVDDLTQFPALAKYLGLYDDARRRLLMALQRVHDNELQGGPKEILTPLRRIADEFNLSPAVLDEEP